MHSQNDVSAYFVNKQILPSGKGSVCSLYNVAQHSSLQSQSVVSAHFKSEQILPFGKQYLHILQLSRYCLLVLQIRLLGHIVVKHVLC